MDVPSTSARVQSPSTQPHPRPTREHLRQVEKALENLSQCLFEMEEKAGHVHPDQEDFMMATTATLIRHFEFITSQSMTLGPDFTIPKSAVKAVDEGKNPQLWTQRALLETLAENQLQKGKLEALDSYRSQYAHALRESYPDLVPLLPSPKEPLPAVKSDSAEAQPSEVKREDGTNAEAMQVDG